MNRMDGKICVITGATQGLGAAIANRFAQAGAAGIVVTGRSDVRGAAMVERIRRETGVAAVFVQGDVGDVIDSRRIITAAEEEFGTVHVLVNAAGMTDRGTIVDTSPELFDRMFAVNVRGPFFLMQETIRHMIGNAIEGSILNIGSMSEHAGQPFLSAYSASKGALATLTRNTAFAVMANRIRVNQLNIGWTSSDHERELQAAETGDPDWEKKAAASLPFGRLIDPNEAARAVNFIVSDDAGLMTGAVVNFDQSIWGAAEKMPIPSTPMSLG